MSTRKASAELAMPAASWVVWRLKMMQAHGSRAQASTRLVVALDQPDRAVHDRRVAIPEGLGGVRHEGGEGRPRHVDLGDDLAAGVVAPVNRSRSAW